MEIPFALAFTAGLVATVNAAASSSQAAAPSSQTLTAPGGANRPSR